MLISMLYSKLRLATVTDSSFKYHGSIGIDEDIMDALGIIEYQVVNVNSISGDLRTQTYAIPEERGSGAIVARGALSNFLIKGDQCHINVYCQMTRGEANEHKPIIIETNEAR